MTMSIQEVFAQMSPEEAEAAYQALAQWADNERSRDDLDDHDEVPSLLAVEAVVERCEAAKVEGL